MADEFCTADPAALWDLGHPGPGPRELFLHDSPEERNESEKAALYGWLCDTVSRYYTVLSVHLLARETKSQKPGGPRGPGQTKAGCLSQVDKRVLFYQNHTPIFQLNCICPVIYLQFLQFFVYFQYFI